MKHRQHILAVDKAAFGIEPLTGWIDMNSKDMFEAIGKSLFIGRRHELETDERFGQILPYVVLWQRTPIGPKVFVYQRMKTVGEERLAGALSVGIGGHIDLADVALTDGSVIDVVATLAGALSREMNEEIGFRVSTDAERTCTFDELRKTIHHERGEVSPFPKFKGLINDRSNEVGRVHYGFVFAMEIPAGFEPYTLEEELSTVGLVDVHLAASKGEGSMENWSNIVLANVNLEADLVQ